MSYNLKTLINSNLPSFNSGFTIVELLVVIVVIGILATITVVGYIGISQKAIMASLQSDLSNASTQIKMFQVDNGSYPTTISTNCATYPTTTTNKCLVASQGTIYSYNAINSSVPQSFSLTATNSGLSYVITNDTKPTLIAPAPLNPIADWMATPQGDHYGNFYDSVTKSWASVTRASPKTVYDSNAQRIYDVPANYLSINPRSDGKSGSEAVVEEQRTNYLANSYFSIDSDTDGLGDNWNHTGYNAGGVSTFSLIPDSVYGSKAQRFQYTSSITDSGVNNNINQASANSSFAAGDAATFSFWVKGSLTGCILNIYMASLNSSGVTIGSAGSSSLSVSQNYTRYAYTYTNLPPNTNRVLIAVNVDNIDNGDFYNISIAAAQLEKGAFVTSYIPSTTALATRNADEVSIPTSNFSASVGTLMAVAANPASAGGKLFGWMYDNSNLISLYQGSVGQMAIDVRGGGTSRQSYKTGAAGYFVHTGIWSVGSSPFVYLNGVKGSDSGVLAGAPSGLPSTAVIGALPGNGYYNGPIQRLTIYKSVLSDSDILSVTSVIQNGP